VCLTKTSPTCTRFTIFREDLLLLFNLRATLEGDTDLSDALKASFDNFKFDGFVNVVGAKGTDASVDVRAFRNLFYPLPASWRVGCSSKNGLLLVDMRANNMEVAIASKQFAEEKKLLGCVNETMLTQSASFLPDGSHNALAKEFGATRMGNVFYMRSPGSVPWQVVDFADTSIRLNSVAQFVFEFPDSSSPLKYLEEGIVRGQAGDQGPPLNCKVDKGLTSRLREMLRINSEDGDDILSNIATVKVLSGSHSMGPINFFGVSVLAAIQKHFVRFWMNVEVSESGKAAGTKAALFLAKKGLRFFCRQSTGYHLSSTKAAIVQAAMDPHHAVDLCSFCGRPAEDDEPLKRCSACANARYCSTDCQARHWKMKGPNGHKSTCSRGKKISIGSRVVISGLQSESGQKMNGKEAIVLAESNADGRVELVLLSTLARIEHDLLEKEKEIPSGHKKLIKIQNINLL